MRFIKTFSFLFVFVVLANITNAQEAKPELQASLAEKSAELAKIQGEVDALKGKIAALPGWRTGLVGVVGFDLNGNNNWYALTTPNASSRGFNVGVSAFANLIQPKYFWRNMLNVTLGQVDTKVDKDAESVRTLNQGLDFSTLLGYRLNSKIAISAEGTYTTAILNYDNEKKKYESAFNNPAKLTFSAGATWTPINNLVVIFHPLGYELNFPGELISAPGCKIGASYSATLWRGIAWSSNLSAFVPYSAGDGKVKYDALDKQTAEVEYGVGDLINYTWINGFSMKIFNGITVALNVGLRGDNQVADKGKYAVATDLSKVTPKGLDLQTYYTLGVGYTF